MKLSLRATALTSSIMWGLVMLIVGFVHMMEPSYGGEFLRMMSSVYPGADTAPTWGRIMLGTFYGLVDGAIGGWLFGLLYDTFVRSSAALSK